MVFVTDTNRVPSEVGLGMFIHYLDVSVKGLTDFFFLHVSSLRRQVTWAAIDFLHRSEIQRGTFFRFHFTRTNSPPNNKPVLDFESHCVSENSCNFCGTIFVVNL